MRIGQERSGLCALTARSSCPNGMVRASTFAQAAIVVGAPFRCAARAGDPDARSGGSACALRGRLAAESVSILGRLDEEL